MANNNHDAADNFQQQSYETISNIIKFYQEKTFEKINLYGVITFMQSEPKKNNSKDLSLAISIADNTCNYNEKLKINVFSPMSAINHLILSHCEVGDIIRFHRIRINNFNGAPQGVCGTLISSWIRFKRVADENDFSFEGCKNSIITEYDKMKVKELRDWLKTRPNVQAVIEAFRYINQTNEINNQNDELFNNNQTSHNENQLNPFDSLRFKLNNAIPITYSKVPQTGYFDIICQVCAICDSKGTKFILAWDGTKSDLAVYQESDFIIESRKQNHQEVEIDRPTTSNDAEMQDASDEQEDKKVFYSKPIISYLFQIYVFDEFISQLSSLKPGDIVLIKNGRSLKPTNSLCDTIIKVPGVGSNNSTYGRSIVKIASLNDDVPNLFNSNQSKAEEIVRFISAKAKELNMDLYSDEEFRNEYVKEIMLNDDTLSELGLGKAQADANQQTESTCQVIKVGKPSAPKRKMSKVDQYLADDEKMYESSSEEDEEANKSNKENQTEMSTRKQQNLNSEDKLHSTIAIKSPVLGQKCQKNLNQSLLQSNQTLTNTLEGASPIKISKLTPKKTGSENELEELTIIRQFQTQEFVNISPAHASNTNASSRKQINDSEKLNINKISPDINQIKMLKNSTYLVSFMPNQSDQVNSLTYVPYFQSVKGLIHEAQKNDYMKCKIVAKFKRYAITSPQLTSIFVYCKKCNYVNFVPFHLASIHQSNMLNKILNDQTINNSNQNTNSTSARFESSTQKESQTANNFSLVASESREHVDEFEEGLYKNGQSFSLEWLQTAMPIDTTQSSQQSQCVGVDSSQIIMYYSCPRCYYNEYSTNKEGFTSSQTPCERQLLDYMYRFWFTLHDSKDHLEPCLVEADIAQRMLNPTLPIKFLSDPTKAQQVYKQIQSIFHKDAKYVFTIETFKLTDKNSSEKLGNMLYKIVDIENTGPAF